jgi:hypothetical protein
MLAPRSLDPACLEVENTKDDYYSSAAPLYLILDSYLPYNDAEHELITPTDSPIPAPAEIKEVGKLTSIWRKLSPKKTKKPHMSDWSSDETDEKLYW